MKERSRTEYSLINMFTGMAGYAINTIVGFACRVIFVRTLSADYLGVSGLFANVLSMLSLAELGISSAITYALYKPIAEKNEEKITSIMHFYKKAYMVIGIIVAIVGLSIIPFLEKIITNPPNIKENIYLLYLLFLTNTVLSYFFSYKSTLLIAMQRQYIVSGYNYVVTIVQSILQVVFLLVTHEYIWYLLIQIIGGILYNIWISRKTSHDYPYIDDKDYEKLSKSETWELLKNVKALAVNKISGILVNSTDNIAITYFVGLSTVGFASNYTLLSSTLDKLTTLLFNGLTGSVGNLNASSNIEQRYEFFKALNLANFWLFGWCAIGMAFVSGDLVQLLFGEEFVLPLQVPIILAVNMYSIGMLHASYTYKSTLGLFQYGQYLLIFTGIINVVLDIILGRIYGVFGIYVATLIARLCTNIWYEPYAVYKYGFKKNPILYLNRYLHFLVTIGLSGIMCYFICEICQFKLIINIMIKMFICTIIPFSIFYIRYRKTEEFIYLKKSVKKIVVKAFDHIYKGGQNA
ncbi:MAG: hypothetical protein IJ356_11545 [Erysipelotrichaceae bacterium]|nr:hypothetical protein [Erysipelotrichaceae bacterium]